MTTTRTAVVLLGGLALAATACSGPGDAGAASQTPVDGATFGLAIASDPGNLDPHMSVLSVTGRPHSAACHFAAAHPTRSSA
jgi:peptide/nickel transport system substrate-binding protein